MSAWDGAEMVRYEILVREAASNLAIDGAELKLLIAEPSCRLQKQQKSILEAKTNRGTATLRGLFMAGGTCSQKDDGSIESFESNVRTLSACIQCQAEGYETAKVTLEPILHFKWHEPRIVIVGIKLKRNDEARRPLPFP